MPWPRWRTSLTTLGALAATTPTAPATLLTWARGLRAARLLVEVETPRSAGSARLRGGAQMAHQQLRRLCEANDVALLTRGRPAFVKPSILRVQRTERAQFKREQRAKFRLLQAVMERRSHGT